MNKYNVIYIIKYSCIYAISIFNNPGAIFIFSLSD